MEHAQVVVFWLAFLLYAGGFVCFAYFLFSRREAQNRLGLTCVAAGWALETVTLVAALGAGRARPGRRRLRVADRR